MSKINGQNIVNIFFNQQNIIAGYYQNSKVFTLTSEPEENTTIYITSFGTEHGYLPLSYWWNHNYEMEIDAYLLDNTDNSGDRVLISSGSGESIIELRMYSSGYYLDYHYPTSTTAPTASTSDYNTRLLRGGVFSNYQNGTHVIMKLKTTPTLSMNVIIADTGETIENYSKRVISRYIKDYCTTEEYTTTIFKKDALVPIAVGRITVYDENGNKVNNIIFKDRGESYTIDRIYSYDTITERVSENLSETLPIDFIKY